MSVGHDFRGWACRLAVFHTIYVYISPYACIILIYRYAYIYICIYVNRCYCLLGLWFMRAWYVCLCFRDVFCFVCECVCVCVCVFVCICFIVCVVLYAFVHMDEAYMGAGPLVPILGPFAMVVPPCKNTPWRNYTLWCKLAAFQSLSMDPLQSWDPLQRDHFFAFLTCMCNTEW
jgi:hypothetical protein